MLLAQDGDVTVYRDIDPIYGDDEENGDEGICWDSEYSLRDPDWCIPSEEGYLLGCLWAAKTEFQRLLHSHTNLSILREARADLDEIQAQLNLLAILPSYQELCGGAE